MCVCSVVFNSLWPHGQRSPPGILQTRTLEWVAMPSSRGSSWSRGQTHISYVFCTVQVGSLSLVPLGKSQSQSVKSLIHVQLFATPWSVHGILQARRLKWAAMPSSRQSSRPRDWTNIFCVSHLVGRFFTTEPTGETQSYRTESYTWRIWCSLWIDIVRTEVNCRTLSWYLITAWIWGRKPTHHNWWPQL